MQYYSTISRNSSGYSIQETTESYFYTYFPEMYYTTSNTSMQSMTKELIQYNFVATDLNRPTNVLNTDSSFSINNSVLPGYIEEVTQVETKTFLANNLSSTAINLGIIPRNDTISLSTTCHEENISTPSYSIKYTMPIEVSNSIRLNTFITGKIPEAIPTMMASATGSWNVSQETNHKFSSETKRTLPASVSEIRKYAQQAPSIVEKSNLSREVFQSVRSQLGIDTTAATYPYSLDTQVLHLHTISGLSTPALGSSLAQLESKSDHTIQDTLKKETNQMIKNYFFTFSNTPKKEMDTHDRKNSYSNATYSRGVFPNSPYILPMSIDLVYNTKRYSGPESATNITVSNAIVQTSEFQKAITQTTVRNRIFELTTANSRQRNSKNTQQMNVVVSTIRNKFNQELMQKSITNGLISQRQQSITTPIETLGDQIRTRSNLNSNEQLSITSDIKQKLTDETILKATNIPFQQRMKDTKFANDGMVSGSNPSDNQMQTNRQMVFKQVTLKMTSTKTIAISSVTKSKITLRSFATEKSHITDERRQHELKALDEEKHVKDEVFKLSENSKELLFNSSIVGMTYALVETSPVTHSFATWSDKTLANIPLDPLGKLSTDARKNENMEVMKQLEKNGIGFSVDNVETPKLNSNSLSTDNIRGPSEPEFYKLLKNKQQFSISVMDKELFEKMNIAHEQFQALPVVERLKLFKMEDLLETQNIEKNSLAVNGRIKDFSPYIFAMLAPDVMSNLGYSFDDMVIHCKFRGLQCENGIRNITLLSNPIYNNCFKIGEVSNLSVVSVTRIKSGISEGDLIWSEKISLHNFAYVQRLQIILSVDQAELISSSEDVGFSLLITQQDETPLPHILGSKIDPGFITHISLFQTDERKSHFSRYCRADDNYPIEACQIQCSQHKLMQYCNCTDPWESINADTVCLIHQKECVEAYYQNCNPLQAKPGQCPAKCETTMYKQFFTKTRMNMRSIMQMCNTKPIERNMTCLNSKQMSVVYVYYQTEISLAYTELASYPTIQLFGDISNIGGLAVGIDMLSVPETIIAIGLCVHFIYRKISH